MQYAFSQSTLQLPDIAKGKRRVILFKWLDESEAGNLAYLKSFTVKHWQHNFEGRTGKGSEQTLFEIQCYWIHIPKEHGQCKYPREHCQCIEVSFLPTTAKLKRLRDQITLYAEMQKLWGNI